MKILLLSAYHAASHQQWCDGLMATLIEHEWTCLTLPPRHFNWRVRGNSLSWALTERQLLSRTYDLIVATSMVDLSALRGFIPSLAAIPTLLYFHENQFAYPASELQFSSVEPQILSIYSAFCADQLVFNSEFNRQTFFTGAEALIRKLPDGIVAADLQVLRGRSSVIPVPLGDSCFSQSLAPRARVPIELIWNHRWEYDKGPDRLLLALQQLTHIPFVVHVVGQQFRRQPDAFLAIQQLLVAHGVLGQWGYLDSRDHYQQLLNRCHGVISTALHDFQGLAVMEAVASGCVPIVPARQAYPEWFGESHCYRSCIEDPLIEAQALAVAMEQLSVNISTKQVELLIPDLSDYAWSRLAEVYRQQFEGVAG